MNYKQTHPNEYSEGFNLGENYYNDGHELPLTDAPCKYKAKSDEYYAFQDGWLDGYIHAMDNDIKLKEV